MKILLLSPLPPPSGGIATWTEKYREYCRENCQELAVVDTALTGSRRENSGARRNFVQEIKRTFGILRALRRQLKEFAPDIVHVNSSCSAFGILRDSLCVSMAKRKKIACLLQCHCNVESQIKTNFAKRILRNISARADAVLTLNRASERYIRSLGCNSVFTVPNFIEKEALCAGRSINPIVKDILFVGHICTDKGCREICAAAKSFPDITFTLVGEISPEFGGQAVPDNVTLTGGKNHDEVKKYLASADVFLFPSYREGFSLALTEAMAAGLPVIASDVGANAEMFEGGGGIVIQPRDESAIVRAIGEMANAAARRTMSVRNLEKVGNCYLRDAVIGRMIDIYKSLQ